jgi:hypothetical protein
MGYGVDIWSCWVRYRCTRNEVDASNENQNQSYLDSNMPVDVPGVWNKFDILDYGPIYQVVFVAPSSCNLL